MNAIKQIFSSITDDELKKAVDEILQSEETGLIGDTVRHQ
jgi:hypothetical protein